MEWNRYLMLGLATTVLAACASQKNTPTAVAAGVDSLPANQHAVVLADVQPGRGPGTALGKMSPYVALTTTVEIDIGKISSDLNTNLAAKEAIDAYHGAIEKMIRDAHEDPGDLRFRGEIQMASRGLQIAGSSSGDHPAILRLPLRIFMSVDPDVGKNRVFTDVWIDVTLTRTDGLLKANLDVTSAWIYTEFDGGFLNPMDAGDRTRSIRGKVDQYLVPYVKDELQKRAGDWLNVLNAGQRNVELHFVRDGHIVGVAKSTGANGPALEPAGTLYIDVGGGHGGKPESFESSKGKLGDFTIHADRILDGAWIDKATRIGGTGGKETVVRFAGDEEWVGTSLRVGRAVDQVTLITTKRQIGPFGGMGGDPTAAVFVPAGYRITGLAGAGGSGVDRLVLIATPIERR